MKGGREAQKMSGIKREEEDICLRSKLLSFGTAPSETTMCTKQEKTWVIII